MSDSQAQSRLFDLVTDFQRRSSRVTHVKDFARREAVIADWPDWLAPGVIEGFTQAGIAQPWLHQVRAASLAFEGVDTVISTGTASGKSLAFTMPIAHAAHTTRDEVGSRGATSLYISPTKALGHDQLEKVRSLPIRGLRVASYDGDTSQQDREWARAHGNVIFTNPDMLHLGILPSHTRFRRWFKTLRYVVVDEAHRYRGVFGSHVALIVRRLLRIAEHYGARPVIIAASATMADPAEAFARFSGRTATAVTHDHSPRGAGQFLLWEPPLLEGWDPSTWGPDSSAEPDLVTEESSRRSTISEAADILADTTCAGYRSIAFIGSRKGTEYLAEAVRGKVAEVAPEFVRSIASYRGGYLPEERRLLETGLRSGALRTVASTNALELGIDVSGLDVVIIVGWPGTLASLWQQAGRAGRSGQDWIAVFVARTDPLDTYVVHHPETVFDCPVDAGVIDPENPHVLGGHLLAAAAERPLTVDDLPRFGTQARAVVDDLADQKLLRARPTGWYWTIPESAAAQTDIRGSGGGQISIIEADTGTVLGTVDEASAAAQCHPGAVYVHQGEFYRVAELDLGSSLAVVDRDQPTFTTRARSATEISIVDTARSFALSSGITVNTGTVEVTDHVTGYTKHDRETGAFVGSEHLEMPSSTLETRAVWWTIPDDLLEELGLGPGVVHGAVHAAEHASIGVLPLFAGCDRWDIGGVSTARHHDTGLATIFVYDGHPGGAGFAERGFDVFYEWHTATSETIEQCECASGCPSCVQSPKCGNGNEPLDKYAAESLLRALRSR